jgi:DNA polymerase-3 subunit beta
MKFEVDRELFTDSLQGVVNTIPPRTSYPVLQNVLVEVKGNRLVMIGTDLETYVRKELPLAPESKPATGKVVMPGRKLLEVATELDEPLLRLSRTDARVKLESGPNAYTFAGLDPADYPEWPTMPDGQPMDVPLALLELAVEATAFAASRDEGRPAMTGLCWETDAKEMRMVATDGHRLAYVRCVGEFRTQGKVIVHPKVLGLLPRGEESVKVTTDTGKIALEFANTTVISRLIEGPYPDYTRVIPKGHPNRLKVNRGKLSAALRRAAVFANPVAKPVTFDFSADRCQLLAEMPELGQAEEVLEARYEGKPVRTAFNAGFVLEFLRHMPVDDIVMELDTAMTAGVFRPDRPDADRLFLLMPIRMD